MGHESSGRSGHKEPSGLSLESDFYAGGHGYLHAGVGLLTPLGDANKGALTFHIVRERSGESWSPSLGAEVGHTFANGIEAEGFSFGYFPVEGRHAWALGARLLKPFEPANGWTLAPFVGPTFARVRCEDEASGTPADVSHTMLIGGLALSRDSFEVRCFGSRSWFSRAVEGLETPVDLEEMTHFAAYENNDGFARWSVGVEAEWEIVSRFELSVRYAAIFFPGESARHSVAVLPGWRVSEKLTFSTGVQFLQGAGAHRALFVSTLGWTF
jgi:hypothetical protein